MKSLLSGQEVQLNEGAFGSLSEQILRMFTELKAIQKEQIASQGLDNIPVVSVLTIFSYLRKSLTSIISIDFTRCNRKGVYASRLRHNKSRNWHWRATVFTVN